MDSGEDQRSFQSATRRIPCCGLRGTQAVPGVGSMGLHSATAGWFKGFRKRGPFMYLLTRPPLDRLRNILPAVSLT